MVPVRRTATVEALMAGKVEEGRLITGRRAGVHGMHGRRVGEASASVVAAVHVATGRRRRGIVAAHGVIKLVTRRGRHHGLRRRHAVKVLAAAGALAAAAVALAAAATAPATTAATSRVVAVGRGDPVQLGVRLGPVGARGPGRHVGLVVGDVTGPLLHDGGAARGAGGPGHEADGRGLLLGEVPVGGGPIGPGAAVVSKGGAASRRHDCDLWELVVGW